MHAGRSLAAPLIETPSAVCMNCHWPSAADAGRTVLIMEFPGNTVLSLREISGWFCLACGRQVRSAWRTWHGSMAHEVELAVSGGLMFVQVCGILVKISGKENGNHVLDRMAFFFGSMTATALRRERNSIYRMLRRPNAFLPFYPGVPCP